MTDLSYSKKPKRSSGGSRARAKKPPPAISLADFERAAAKHLDRYPSTTAGLRAVLERRAQRSCAHHGGEPSDARSIIDSVLTRCEGLGLLDDGALGRSLVQKLRNRGFSVSRMRNQLLGKGFSEDLCEDLLREVDETDQELTAARIHAKRRGLGPHRKPPEHRDAYRERDLGALGRAGFSFEIAQMVIDEPESV